MMKGFLGDNKFLFVSKNASHCDVNEAQSEFIVPVSNTTDNLNDVENVISSARHFNNRFNQS